MNELLPPNSTPLERAIDAAAASRFDRMPVLVRHLWNPATCPPEWLGLLAWALSVDTWRSDWPEATKRAVIAASPRVHRLKGTVAAVKAAIAALGATGRIIEWFQPGGTGVPYTAVVEVDVTQGPGDPSLTRDLVAAVEGSKNARSHLQVQLVARNRSGLVAAALMRRPLSTVALTVSGDFRPKFQTSYQAAALNRRPVIAVALSGTAA